MTLINKDVWEYRMKKEILSLLAPQPVGSYSQAVSKGPWLFVSGQIPLEPKTGEMISGSIALQTERVMENIKAVLEENNMNFNHVVKAGIFLKDMDNFSVVNKVYSRYFKKPFPARSCVAVSDLPKGSDVEIEVIAFSN